MKTEEKNILLIFSTSLLFLPVTLKLAYFTPLNGAGCTFPVNFNYQRCLENSNMINFWLTSWITSWWQIKKKKKNFLPRTRVCNKEPLIDTTPKYYFDNPVRFLETRGKNWLIYDPCFVCTYFWQEESCGWEKKV